MAELELPFALRGHSGRVQVTVQANRDPRASGHELVAANFDAITFQGFPIAMASIEYDAAALRAIMGWVQVIRHLDTHGKVTDLAVDRFPLGPEDSPLYGYGYLPVFFDAPANPDHPDGVWQADTWLVAIPDVIRTRRLAGIVASRRASRAPGPHLARDRSPQHARRCSCSRASGPFRRPCDR